MKIPIRLRVAAYVTLSYAVVIIVVGYTLIELYEGYSYRAFDVTIQAAATSVANRVADINPIVGLKGIGEDVEETISNFENRIGLIHIGIFNADNGEVFSLNDIDSMIVKVPIEHKRKFKSVHWEGKKYRVAFASFEISDTTQGMVVAMSSLAPLHESIDRIRGLVFVIAPITILLVGLGSVLIARRALRPLERMAQDIDGMKVNSPTIRLQVPRTKDEIERVGQSFNSLMERIVKLIGSQRNFLLDASHELKTPLTVIQAEIEMLQMNPNLSAEEKDNLQHLVSEVEYASKLAVDLIYLSRLESSVASFMLLDVRPIVAEVVGRAMPVAAKKGVSLHATVPEQSMVRGDPVLLKRAISNVVENAVKYCRKGGKARVSGHVDREASRFFLTVEDNGPGISAEELPRVFDRFYRTRSSRGGDEKGSGLGLSIVKRIIEQHDGEVKIESEQGAGTRFMLSLPLAR